MKNIALILIIALSSLSFSQAGNDGNLKSIFKSIKLNQNNSCINLTIDLIEKAEVRMVLVNESGEELRILEERLIDSDHYQVEFSTQGLAAGEYIFFIESDNNIHSEFFELNANNNLIQTKIENQFLHIYSSMQEPDYLITIFSEDGLIHKTLGMKGNAFCSDEVTIDISDWQSGDYFILLQNDTILSSFYFQIP